MEQIEKAHWHWNAFTISHWDLDNFSLWNSSVPMMMSELFSPCVAASVCMAWHHSEREQGRAKDKDGSTWTCLQLHGKHELVASANRLAPCMHGPSHVKKHPGRAILFPAPCGCDVIKKQCCPVATPCLILPPS